MNFVDIQQSWASQPAPSPDGAVWADVTRRAAKLNRKVKARDLVELVTSVGLAGVFFWMATLAPVAWPWIAAGLIVLLVGGVFVRERVRVATRVAPPTDVRRALEMAIDEAEHQMQLLGSVALWYLAPLGVVAALVLTGAALGVRADVTPEVWQRMRGGLIGVTAVMPAIVGGLFYGVWWLNRRAVTAHLTPHRDHLRAALEQLATVGGDVEEK